MHYRFSLAIAKLTCIPDGRGIQRLTERYQFIILFSKRFKAKAHKIYIDRPYTIFGLFSKILLVSALEMKIIPMENIAGQSEMINLFT